jgi:hypothetical protein
MKKQRRNKLDNGIISDLPSLELSAVIRCRWNCEIGSERASNCRSYVRSAEIYPKRYDVPKWDRIDHMSEVGKRKLFRSSGGTPCCCASGSIIFLGTMVIARIYFALQSMHSLTQ